MIPTIEERLDSIIRSLSQVVLPQLPADASLAQEQVHLSLGHLQIMLGQLTAAPAFEQEEAADAALLAEALIALGGASAAPLAAAVAAVSQETAQTRLLAINSAIDRCIRDAWAAPDEAARDAVSEVVLRFEALRIRKDRDWCKPFGFDAA